MSDYLHIVCLDAPAPPNYGGAIDMFNKVKALHGIGKKIFLHYFNYRAERSAAGLEPFCQEIHTYTRRSIFRCPPLQKPFIVQSRVNAALIDRLNGDEHPVLLEGLHCAGLVAQLNKPERAVIRMHNEEARYYHHLSLTASSRWKRLYYKRESLLLRRYQQTLNKNIPLACLSETDVDLLQHNYGFCHTMLVPCFIPWQEVKSGTGSGAFCLYHGNLSVPENQAAALWLVQRVFASTDFPLIIAGSGNPKALRRLTAKLSNVTLILEPSMEELDRLVAAAQVHVLPSMNATGVKLKLLNALLNGRHCITNENGINGSGIATGLYVVEDAESWRQTVSVLLNKPFNDEDCEERNSVLKLYNNRENAKRLNALW